MSSYPETSPDTPESIIYLVSLPSTHTPSGRKWGISFVPIDSTTKPNLKPTKVYAPDLLPATPETKASVIVYEMNYTPEISTLLWVIGHTTTPTDKLVLQLRAYVHVTEEYIVSGAMNEMWILMFLHHLDTLSFSTGFEDPNFYSGDISVDSPRRAQDVARLVAHAGISGLDRTISAVQSEIHDLLARERDGGQQSSSSTPISWFGAQNSPAAIAGRAKKPTGPPGVMRKLYMANGRAGGEGSGEWVVIHEDAHDTVFTIIEFPSETSGVKTRVLLKAAKERRASEYMIFMYAGETYLSGQEWENLPNGASVMGSLVDWFGQVPTERDVSSPSTVLSWQGKMPLLLEKMTENVAWMEEVEYSFRCNQLTYQRFFEEWYHNLKTLDPSQTDQMCPNFCKILDEAKVDMCSAKEMLEKYEDDVVAILMKELKTDELKDQKEVEESEKEKVKEPEPFHMGFWYR